MIKKWSPAKYAIHIAISPQWPLMKMKEFFYVRSAAGKMKAAVAGTNEVKNGHLPNENVYAAIKSFNSCCASS
ncbi:MAG: hypothetical protein V1706_13220 [Pseudomonadota bacterium]